MVRKVKFLGDATSTQYGSFRTGDIATVSDEFGAHVVDELKIAQYHGAAKADADDDTAAARAARTEPAKPARAAAKKAGRRG